MKKFSNSRAEVEFRLGGPFSPVVRLCFVQKQQSANRKALWPLAGTPQSHEKKRPRTMVRVRTSLTVRNKNELFDSVVPSQSSQHPESWDRLKFAAMPFFVNASVIVPGISRCWKSAVE